MRLFLFDVDGTLLNAHGAGRIALARALEATYGTAGSIRTFDTRGKTDPQIVIEVMRAADVPDAVIRSRLETFFEAYLRSLETLIDNGHPVEAMPGIPQVVEALGTRDDALVGLLTGNIEQGAQIKLRPTGLLPFFRIGAFGSDDPDRRHLPAIARQRARALVRRDVPFGQITIIGDTPLDVDCALACGARAVAVATGQHSPEELATCFPDLLLPDFSNVQAALQALTQG